MRVISAIRSRRSSVSKHAIDQELFDQTFGEGAVKDEAEFRAKIPKA
jgi:hypothetical protein